MRDYAKIATSIWDSQKFQSVDNEAKLLYFYLHTCKFVNMVGCFVLKEGYALADLGWDAKAYRKAIDTLSKANLIAIDNSENLIRIVGFIQKDPFTNTKHAEGGIKIAEKLPDCMEKLNLFIELKGGSYCAENERIAQEIDRLSIAYAEPIETRNRNRSQIQEPEQDNNISSLRSDICENDKPKKSEIENQAVEIWNAMAKANSLPCVQRLTDSRKRLLQARLKDVGGIEGWKLATEKVAASDFLTGRVGDGKWVADFDFFIRQSSFTKLMECKYDNRTSNNETGYKQGGNAGRCDPGIELVKAGERVARSYANE